MADAPSIVPMYREIFVNEIYRFRATTDSPRIIDGGANIGLSVLYFKRLYPASSVLAFEPDIRLWGLLQKNINTFGVTDVEAVNAAIWSENSHLSFYVEGSDSGSLVNSARQSRAVQKVRGQRLRDLLERHVDFLKLDIEGAETRVLEDCRTELKNVENVFVEYHSFIGEKQTLSLLLRILEESGFRLHIYPSVCTSNAFVRRLSHNGMDMAVNISGFRC